MAKVPAVCETRVKPIVHGHTHTHTRATHACACEIAASVLKRSCPKLPGGAIDKEREQAGTGSN